MKALWQFWLSILLIIVTCASCEGHSDFPTSAPSWDQAHVATLRLQLADPDYVQELWFSADGSGTGSFGDKSGVTPVIFYWRISQGRLILSTDRSTIEELALVSESAGQIVARDKSGKLLTYRKLGR